MPKFGDRLTCQLLYVFWILICLTNTFSITAVLIQGDRPWAPSWALQVFYIGCAGWVAGKL